MNPTLPSADLLKLQANWLADARARILRNAEIARRKRVLDLGAGYGFMVPELKRRASGSVIALDRSMQALCSFTTEVPVVCGDAIRLPFHNRTFDLIFSQNLMLWVKPLRDAALEISRVLIRGGTWVLLEPDYGGLMEYPHELETRDLWIQALHRAGADPVIGRKLPPLLSSLGFMVRVELLPRLAMPHSARFDFLEELPLTAQEKQALKEMREMAEEINPAQQVAHLPYFLIIADHP